MKASGAAGLLLLLLAPLAADAASSGMSPLTRVVELLQGLSKKIVVQGKVEEDMYEKFVCWGDSVIASKTASNSAAKSRIDELEAYMADVKAGKIEFTSERVDLEHEIANLESDIQASTAMRKKEVADYEAAVVMMQKAIDALQRALEVLGEATSLTPRGTLLSVRSRLNEGFKQRLADSAALTHAIEFGKEFLSRGDAEFLRRLLSADVPEVDWKKLNRKAVFKMKYKARSSKIQEIITKLLQTFETNLNEADAKEKKAQETYDKLMSSLDMQLEKAHNSLNDLMKEGAAAGLSLADAEAEVESLDGQIDADLKFIEQTKTTMSDTKGEWKDRQVLRTGELAAISKAVSILNSDDARDTFKKSMKSQGYSLLQMQEGATAAQKMGARDAGAVLRGAGQQAGDPRLLALAVKTGLQETGHFDDVLAAIDKMITTLQAEAEEDLHLKEHCEEERSQHARDAVVASRAIDERTDAIRTLVGDVTALQAEIAEKQKTKAELLAEAARAGHLRNEEHAQWEKDNADDVEAEHLISSAKQVLEDFYRENNLVLAQRRGARVVPVEAGRAPPPPPPTWEAPYSGGTEANQGIVGILSMIQEDIASDRQRAEAEEQKADDEFLDFMKENAAAVDEHNTAITELEAEAAKKAMEANELKSQRLDDKGSLDALMKTIKDLSVSCDYYAVHFPVRAKNRAIEIDGLSKAKAILQGAAFSPLSTDATREIKPGDALLQRRA